MAIDCWVVRTKHSPGPARALESERTGSVVLIFHINYSQWGDQSQMHFSQSDLEPSKCNITLIYTIHVVVLWSFLL